MLIYYASSDTRMHVATSSLDRLLDYVINTPEDGFRSAASVERLNALIDKNLTFFDKKGSQVASNGHAESLAK